MYGFPPLKYDDSKIDKKIYKKLNNLKEHMLINHI